MVCGCDLGLVHFALSVLFIGYFALLYIFVKLVERVEALEARLASIPTSENGEKL